MYRYKYFKNYAVSISACIGRLRSRNSPCALAISGVTPLADDVDGCVCD